MGARRRARRIALQTLYEADTTGHDSEEVLGRLAEEESQPEVAAFAQELVAGVMEHKPRIDAIIASYAPSWPVEQLSVIDRNILRLAIFELLINNKAPQRAVINEAVELAKAFGSDSSPKFINGVLGAVSADRLGKTART